MGIAHLTANPHGREVWPTSGKKLAQLAFSWQLQTARGPNMVLVRQTTRWLDMELSIMYTSEPTH